MIKFKKKHLWIYLIIGIGLYFLFLFYQTCIDYNVLKKEEKALNEKILIEQQKQSTLTKEKKSVENQETIESIARSNLNYLKDNEILFIDGERSE